MEDNIIKPEVLIMSFNESEVKNYINQIDKISAMFGPHQPIVLNISSYGGNVYGLAMLYEYLSSVDNPIVTYTSSKAMSAGSILLASGTPGMRFASKNSTILIHELQSAVYPDDIKNIENSIDNLKRDNEKWMNILARNMKLNSSKDIRKLIQEKSVGHDLILSAHEAKELNIIDEVCYLKLTPTVGYTITTILDEVRPVPKKKLAPKLKK